ncbi:MAG: hypothetical protein K2H15_09250, partial [Muribaculaceae bacterium]|nr:hypothetical protein [Muribaculaceae bacterium]
MHNSFGAQPRTETASRRVFCRGAWPGTACASQSRDAGFAAVAEDCGGRAVRRSPSRVEGGE